MRYKDDITSDVQKIIEGYNKLDTDKLKTAFKSKLRLSMRINKEALKQIRKTEYYKEGDKLLQREKNRCKKNGETHD